MKITEKSLRAMILQELLSTVSPKDRINTRNIQYRTGPFVMLCQTVFESLGSLEDSIRMGSDLEKMDLHGFKNNELQRLRDKISFIESMIDAKLEGKIDDNEGYE
jgi:hypothetical protein